MDRHRAVVSLVVAFLLSFTTSIWAQDPSRQYPPNFPPALAKKLFGKPIENRQLAKPIRAKKVAELTSGVRCKPSCLDLLAKARREGSIYIGVGLNVTNLPDETRVPKEQRLAVLRELEAAVGQAQDHLLRRLSKHKVKNITRLRLSPELFMTVTAPALEILLSDPDVERVYEPPILRPMLPQSTPLIGATNAWAAGFTGAGRTIAVLDTGVDMSHPFLWNKVVTEACFSGSGPGTVSLCPNGQTIQTGPGAGAPCNLPGCSHGTHVAGIAAGRAATFSGVARDANIMAVQVFSDGGGYLQVNIGDLEQALEEVRSASAANGIVAVNLSLGSTTAYSDYCDTDPDWAPVTTSIEALRAQGVATIVASGNNSCTNALGNPTGCSNALSAPACISTAISVGATTKSDTIPPFYFSNSASFLSLLAPGGDGSLGAGDIYSSVPGGGFAYLPGTSMAAPHVAGAFAVLKQQSPTASVSDMLSILESNGVPITDPRNNITKPRIRLSNTPWVARYNGGWSNAIGTDIVGNVYVTGGTANGFTTVKYDPSGRQLWAASYNVFGAAVALAVDGSGNVYVTGPVCTEIDANFCARYVADTVKYSPDGVQLWATRHNPVSGYNTSWPVSIAVDNMGRVYVATELHDGIVTGNQAFATIKYNSDGSQLWERVYGYLNYNAPAAVAVDGTGSVYVTGWSCAFIDSAGCVDFNAATVKYDTNGNRLWVVRDTNLGYAAAIAVDTVGNVHVTGSSGSTAPNNTTIKYDANGSTRWIAVGPGGGAAIALDTSGNVYTTGPYTGLDGISRYATAKYNSNGSSMWTALYAGGANPDWGTVSTNVGIDSAGNSYVTGTVCTVTSGDPCNTIDYVTLKYDTNGSQLWLARQKTVFGGGSGAWPALAVHSGNPHITGPSWTSNGGDSDYLTVKYTPP